MKEVQNSIAVALSAMAGGWLRYQVALLLFFADSFPLGTLLVNYLGTFLLVYIIKGYLSSKVKSQCLILALSTGFCGGLTTFSGLLLDSIKLADSGRYMELLIYLVLSVGGGLAIALWAGKQVKS